MRKVGSSDTSITSRQTQSPDRELERLWGMVQASLDQSFDAGAYAADRSMLLQRLAGMSETEIDAFAVRMLEERPTAQDSEHGQVLLSKLAKLIEPFNDTHAKRLTKLAEIKNTTVDQLERDPDLMRAVRMESLYAMKRKPVYVGVVNALLGQDQQARRALDALGLSGAEVAANFSGFAARLLQTQGTSQKDLEFVSVGNADLNDAIMAVRTAQVFGPPSDKSELRVMATMPTWAAERPEWIGSMVDAGMTTMRINCAHDNPDIWLAHVQNFKAAAPEGTILQDLPGPKLRTGHNKILGHGLKVKVEKHALTGTRDKQGTPIELRFDLAQGRPASETGEPPQIPLNVSEDKLAQLESAHNAAQAAGKKLRLMAHDSVKVKKGKIEANRDCPIIVDSLIKEGDRIVGVRGRLRKTTYFNPDTSVEIRTGKAGRPAVVGQVGALPEVPQDVVVKDGDLLLIKASPEQQGLNAEDAPDGVATIGCQLPEALAQVKVGQDRVFLDDGKIPGLVEKYSHNAKGEVDGIYVRIGESAILDEPVSDRTYAIKERKGINLPDTPLVLDPLTEQDKVALPFVMEHADMIAYSFVQTAEDVNNLVAEATKIAKSRGLRSPEDIKSWFSEKTIVLKIETDKSLDNLVDMISAVREAGFKASVMLARGDLAVEKIPEGSRSPINLGQVTDRVAGVCEALRCPVIYATQLMETMMKKGRINRSESFDMASASATFASVMLNKGDGQNEAMVVREFHRAAQKYGRSPELMEALASQADQANQDLDTLLRS